MKDLPEAAKPFFTERFKKVIYQEDQIFVKRLEEDHQLRNIVYPKLESHLKDWKTWERFLTLVIDCADLMQKEQTAEARTTKKEAEKLQKEIAIHSKNLADSLDKMEELGEKGFIETPYIGNPIRAVMDTATANDQILFDQRIKNNLQKAIVGFDLKYFPTIQDVIRYIGSAYSKEQPIEFSDNYYFLNQRASPREFCVKLNIGIDEHIMSNALPKSFKLTHIQIADFCNALLLDDKKITEANVKTYLNDYKKSQ